MACKFLCVLALVALATGSPSGRITGGSQIAITEAPYAVSIIYTYPGPNITIQRCAGVLISSWHVLTTAYCFRGANIANMQIQAGSINSLSGGVIVRPSHFVEHPGYVQTPRTNDIAVLFMNQPFAITPNVDVAFLPPQGQNLPVGTSVRVVGWGFQTEQANGGTQLPNIHAITLSTVSESACQTAWAGYSDIQIDGNALCANAVGQSTCTGDSGAPLVLSNVLYGLASYYDGCGSTVPDFFTNVPQYTSWIVSVATAPNQHSEGVPVRIAKV